MKNFIWKNGVFASVICCLILLTAPAQASSKESAFDRVIRTGELRCGYWSWNPAFIKDPNTGKLSGIFHDTMEALGKSLRLKIIWSEEIGLADYPAALHSGRIDAMCSSLYATSERARAVDFITPVYYAPVHAYAAAKDSRFDSLPSVAALNNTAYRVAILEGGVTSIIQRQILPETRVYELSQITSPAELFMSLAQRKADFVLYDRFTYEDYNAHNPEKVKRITQKPVKVFPLTIAVGKHQDALREMLNTAMMDLHLAGTIESILQKYETYPDSFLRPALPYRE